MTPPPPEPPVLPEAVLFTFDNAWDSVYTHAYPTLEAQGFKGTVYATSGTIDSHEPYITLAQYQEMYADGWDVGNHCSVHVYLADQTEAEQEAYLETCALYLEANGMPRAARHVAYPNGSWDEDTFTAMAATGMLTGRTFARSGMTEQLTPIVNPYEIKGVYNLYNNSNVRTVEAAQQILTTGSPGRIVTFLVHTLEPAGAESGDPGYEDGTGWTPEAFAELVAYVKGLGVPVVTISQLYAYIQAGYVWP